MQLTQLRYEEFPTLSHTRKLEVTATLSQAEGKIISHPLEEQQQTHKPNTTATRKDSE